MEMNVFQKRVISLWKNDKHNGVNIEAPRQIGKSTVALQIAYNESDKDTAVIFYGWNTDSTRLKEEQYKHNYLGRYEKHFRHKGNVFFVSAQQSGPIDAIKKKCEKEFKNVYFIYDECTDRTVEPNTLKLFTEVNNGIFRFGEEWFDGTTVTPEILNEQRYRLPPRCFASAYNCCIIKRNMFSKAQ